MRTSLLYPTIIILRKTTRKSKSTVNIQSEQNNMQGIQYEGCLKWNHRPCISQQQYHAVMHVRAEIVYFCPLCHPDPVAESSRVSGECNVFNQSDNTLKLEEFNPPHEPFNQSTIYIPQTQVGLISFETSPILRDFDLAYSLLFSGSFKPGIFFCNVVPIY